MEREMSSYLEWQLNVQPSARNESESMVRKDFNGLGPYPVLHTLPAPTSRPFAHPKPSTNNIPTTIPSPGPGAPPSPQSVASSTPLQKSSQQSSVEPYPTPTDDPQLLTPSSSHLNVPSPTSLMSPMLNYEGDSTKIVSSVTSNVSAKIISCSTDSPPRTRIFPLLQLDVPHSPAKAYDVFKCVVTARGVFFFEHVIMKLLVLYPLKLTPLLSPA